MESDPDFWIPIVCYASTSNLDSSICPGPISKTLSHSLQSCADTKARQQLFHSNISHRVEIQLQGHWPLEVL